MLFRSILPALNEPDLAELAEDIRRDMTFVPVETLEQVIAVALSNGQPPTTQRADSAGTAPLTTR